ncbi:hypothetical protein H6F51_21395 [Cyanobacteria bacterium FACHB-DQ100]|nr:hypothetical protein [Cyanobacteria bacterium FACHB-DQ100]
MKLLDSDSIWVFLSGSDEDRFLSDISFGVQCLLHRKFPMQNILLFIDQPSGSNFAYAYSFPTGIQVHQTAQLEVELCSRNFKKLVVVVTGHGGITGIVASPDIQPCPLLEVIKSLTDIEVALVVLGQCYAGTFNFLEARSINQTGKVLPPEICLLGATDLAASLSASVDLSTITTINQFQCSLKWSANLFLIYFMLHVASPIDLDGDNRFTVLDAYKAAGIGTNTHLLNLRQQTLREFYAVILSSTVSQLTQQVVAQQLAEKARQDLMAASEAVLTNQSPWILHANLARKLEL